MLLLFFWTLLLLLLRLLFLTLLFLLLSFRLTLLLLLLRLLFFLTLLFLSRELFWLTPALLLLRLCEISRTGLLFGIGGHAQFLGTEGVAAFHAPGSHEGSSEIRVVKAVDAHARPATGAVDEFPVPHIDAGMVAAAGMVEGHDVTGAPCLPRG